MAIDVKAEAERISRAYIYSKFSYGGDVSGHRKDLHDEILQFASRVRDEAIRETVEHIERLLMMNSCGCLHAIRTAFAATEPKGAQQDSRTLLDSLRWKPDTIITNHDGQRVWLKPVFDETERQVGITDCCNADSPCTRHSRIAERDIGKDDARQRFDKAAVELAKAITSDTFLDTNTKQDRLVEELLAAARELGLDGAA